MNIEDNKNVASLFFEYGNAGNMEASLELLSDDLVWTGVGGTKFSGTFKGKQTVLQELVGPLFSSLKQGIHTSVEKMVAEGSHVVILASGAAETLEGVPYHNRYCFVFTIRDGKIREVVEYCDTALVDEVFGKRAESA